MRCTLLFVFLMIAQHIFAAPDVLIRNRKIFVDSDEYFVKGVLYNPVPLGQYRMTPDGFNGGGLCSNRITPYGDKQSACYDLDYIDGSLSSGSSSLPSPPAGSGWFEQAWRRDFPLIREAGFNTLRILHANPITAQASQNYFGQFGIRSQSGKDHRRFMDLAQLYGFKVIFPLYADLSKMQTVSDDEYSFYLRSQIDEVGDHPALIMYSFGNEDDSIISNWTLSSLKQAAESNNSVPTSGIELNLMRKWMNYARAYQAKKWGRRIPLTSYWNAILSREIRLIMQFAQLPLEVHSLSLSLQNVDNEDSLWSEISDLSCQFGNVILMSGMGLDDVTVRHQSPSYINRHVSLVWNRMDEGVVGGVFNEFSDEPLRSAPLNDLGIVLYEVAQTPQGTNSLQTSVFIADVIAKKQQLFSAAAYGAVGEFASWNFRANPFDLLNRTQSSLSEEILKQSTCATSPRLVSSGELGGAANGTNSTPSPTPSRTLPSWHSPDYYASNATTREMHLFLISAFVITLTLTFV